MKGNLRSNRTSMHQVRLSTLPAVYTLLCFSKANTAHKDMSTYLSVSIIWEMDCNIVLRVYEWYFKHILETYLSVSKKYSLNFRMCTGFFTGEAFSRRGNNLLN